ncbi:hypothetical protein Cylst_3770 [Cylindrospermum stagnale PCC 7417]|uniref:Uncharacterized protein n=1 Tax=Cylindrospermum stagnale PCC 7417 TaxID=56107 RepID=K9X1E1_9NOST|nr:hypothetical protein Cylst_3770 [Cylindrospermum stagnale PCC 7417]
MLNFSSALDNLLNKFYNKLNHQNKLFTIKLRNSHCDYMEGERLPKPLFAVFLAPLRLCVRQKTAIARTDDN